MPSLPRILVISNYGGTLNAVRPEAEIFVGLAKLGFPLWVMTDGGCDYADKFKSLGATVIDYLPKSKFDRKAISLIKKCVDENNIDIVHGFHSKAIACSAWALIGRKTKLVGYRGYTGNIHWYDPSCYLAFLNPRVDYMICLAESVREMFLANGMPERKAITIHKGHKPEWYAGVRPGDLSEFGIQKDEMVFSLVANHRTRMKGMHYLVKASALIPDDLPIKFLIIGKGLDTEEITSMIAKTAFPDRFIYTSFRSDATSIVKACDVSISASLFGEATQKAMIEAMYLGNPVIITDIPGNRGMVVHGSGGFVVPPADAQALADAIISMWNSREKLTAMGTKAKEHIESFLSNDRAVASYAAFYQRIAKP